MKWKGYRRRWQKPYLRLLLSKPGGTKETHDNLAAAGLLALVLLQQCLIWLPLIAIDFSGLEQAGNN